MILAEPAEKPVVTTPVGPTFAVPEALLLQVPPVVASLNVVDKPVQTVVAPVIAAGFRFTVTGTAKRQPVGKV